MFRFPDRYRTNTPEDKTSADSHAFTKRDLKNKGKRRLPDRNSERAVQVANLEMDRSDTKSEKKPPALQIRKSNFDGSETNPFRAINVPR